MSKVRLLIIAIWMSLPFGISAAEITMLKSPAGESSSLSRLSADSSGEVLLSWVESDGDRNVLYFSTLLNQEFTEREMIASGTDWFVNWADFPFVVATGQSMTAHWPQKRDEGTYNYDVVAVFRDPETKAWSEPRIIHTDGVSAEHGFVGMLPVAGNKTFITWLDGRNTGAGSHGSHDASGHGSGGMTLRAGIFNSSGSTQSEWELDNLVCDCCQTSVARSSLGPVVAYRDRTKSEIRDIYIMRLVNGAWTAPTPVYEDNWEIAGCPVNGPSVAALEKQVAVGWYSAKDDLPTVRLSLSADNGATFTNTVTVARQNTNGRVSVAMLESGKVVISWLETDGKLAFIKVAAYNYNGDLLDSATVAETSSSRQSGFPVMISSGDGVFVTWTDVSSEKQVKIARVRF
jgi:hypothetical protein